jgi:hypothetical protein
MTDPTPPPPPAPSYLKAYADGCDTLGIGDSDPVYAGPGPDKPPAAYTTILQTGGLPFNWPTGKIATLTFQVNTIVPASQPYGTAHERAEAAFESLNEKRAWTLNGYTAPLTQALQRPYYHGIVDGKHWFSFNVLVRMRKTPAPVTP